MITIFIRTLITYITLVIIMRLLGKRQIGEMQPFEFVVTLIIADLACVPMSDVSIPLVYGIVCMLTIFLIHQIFFFIEQSGDLGKKILSGKPSIVINKDGIDVKELKRNNLGVDDLIESIRNQGYFSLDDLDYAIFESNGKFSPLEAQNKTEKSVSIPLLIVNQGKLSYKNLELIKMSEKQITDFIESKCKNLKNTEVLTIDGNGRVYIKGKNQKFMIDTLTLPEGVKW